MWSTERRKKGFTLIELLVVIAIIAILAAILFPVFLSAKQSALTTACCSNLRQIATAFALYTGNWDGRCPPLCVGGENGAWVLDVYPPDRRGLLDQYIKTTQLICPCDQLIRQLQGYWLMCSSYGYNAYYLAQQEWGNGSGDMVVPFGAPVKADSFPRPAKIVCFTDKNVIYEAEVATPGHPIMFNTLVYCAQSVGAWHNGGANVLFLDGHLKWMLVNGQWTQEPSGKNRGGIAWWGGK